MSKIAAVMPLAMKWCWFAALGSPGLLASAVPRGLFESHADVGSVVHPGILEYDPAQRIYTVGGSGENLWSTADAFHFVWKKVTGDVSLAADISFLSKGGNDHRKAVLMVRQSLDADSAYADVALHGSGLTALQYRDEKGAKTHEIRIQEVQSNIGSKRLRIEKRGNFVYLFLETETRSCTIPALRYQLRCRGLTMWELGFARMTKTRWRRRRSQMSIWRQTSLQSQERRSTVL